MCTVRPDSGDPIYPKDRKIWITRRLRYVMRMKHRMYSRLLIHAHRNIEILHYNILKSTDVLWNTRYTRIYRTLRILHATIT